eukprot:scaffold2128_cov70-Phaeocystis_antarctica.AAC.5
MLRLASAGLPLPCERTGNRESGSSSGHNLRARSRLALRRGSASITISFRSSRWASAPPAACTWSCSVSRTLKFELKLGSGDMS